jgi:hypothetical protein
MPAVQLSASIADIFTFPAFRQFILNQIDDAVTLGVGLAGSAAGLGQALAAQPAAAATTFSANISSADVTDVPDLSRKTAMVAVSPSTDAVDAPDAGVAEGSSKETQKSGSDQTEQASTGKKTPNANESDDESTAKDSTSAATENSDRGTTNSSKADTETKEGDDSPRHVTKKAETQKANNESQSEAPSRSNAPARRLSDLQRFTSGRRRTNEGCRLPWRSTFTYGFTSTSGCVKRYADVAARRTMTRTCAFDHRIVDGAQVAALSNL